jgi:hypothetical protein
MHARIRRIRVNGTAGNFSLFEKRSSPTTVRQQLRLIAADSDLILAIDLFDDEEAASADDSELQGGTVESTEFWSVLSPLAWTDEAMRLRTDPKRHATRGRLAAELAKRLAPVVPVGFMEETLRAWISEQIAYAFDDLQNPLDAAVVAGASSVLQRLEDDVTATLRVPWWEGQGAWSVEIKDGHLRLGRGLGRIPLTSLGLAE